MTRGLAPVVHGLSITPKTKRAPLPDALEAIEALLRAADGAEEPPAAAAAAAMVLEEEVESGVASGRSGGLTQLWGSSLGSRSTAAATRRWRGCKSASTPSSSR